MQHQTEHDGHKVHAKLADHFGERLDGQNLGGDQEEYAEWRQPLEHLNHMAFNIRPTTSKTVQHLHTGTATHQITHEVIIIMHSLIAVKNSCSGFPFSRILPMVVPSTTLNITMPSTLVVCVSCDLMVHSCVGAFAARIQFNDCNYLVIIICILWDLLLFIGGVRIVRSWNMVASTMFGGNRFLKIDTNKSIT